MFISGEVRPMKKRPPTHTHLQENMAEVLSGWGAALLPLVLEVLNKSLNTQHWRKLPANRCKKLSFRGRQ